MFRQPKTVSSHFLARLVRGGVFGALLGLMFLGAVYIYGNLTGDYLIDVRSQIDMLKEPSPPRTPLEVPPTPNAPVPPPEERMDIALDGTVGTEAAAQATATAQGEEAATDSAEAPSEADTAPGAEVPVKSAPQPAPQSGAQAAPAAPKTPSTPPEPAAATAPAPKPRGTYPLPRQVLGVDFLVADNGPETLCLKLNQEVVPNIYPLEDRIFFNIFGVQQWDGLPGTFKPGKLVTELRTALHPEREKLTFVLHLSDLPHLAWTKSFDKASNTYCVTVHAK